MTDHVFRADGGRFGGDVEQNRLPANGATGVDLRAHVYKEKVMGFAQEALAEVPALPSFTEVMRFVGDGGSVSPKTVSDAVQKNRWKIVGILRGLGLSDSDGVFSLRSLGCGIGSKGETVAEVALTWTPSEARSPLKVVKED